MSDLETLKTFDRILVTGPQRSGTRIRAKHTATLLGYDYVDEQVIKFDSLARCIRVLLSQTKVVLQCPALFCVLHLIDTPRTCAIVCVRDVEDIIKSQERVKWGYGQNEWKKYLPDGEVLEEPISVFRYRKWEKQKKLMRIPYFEANYNELETSSLWIDSEARKNFRGDQTEAIMSAH